MSRVLPVGIVVFVALIAGSDALIACGDKLLPLGRGIRFQSGYTSAPASILVYAPEGSPSATAFGETRLESALTEAGHQIHVVATSQGLEDALRTGQVDIVLVDVRDVAPVEAQIRSASSRPVLLPVVYQGTKDDYKRAEQQYRVALKAPGRAGHFCSIVDKAMEMKVKQVG